jgi:8-amino-7-oxononanoate synthase
MRIRPKLGAMLDAYLTRQLGTLKSQGLFREPADAGAREAVSDAARKAGQTFIDASSNDYLGLAAGVSRETAAAGAGASRLVQGTRREHEALERELADWVGCERALLFSSGYAANAGSVAALAGEDSVLVTDELNHASIIDGCRLARGQVLVTPHLDLAAVDSALSAARMTPIRWVVTESYFSMDGDGPNLAALRAICDRHRAFLIVDEAHGLGVFGKGGAGRCAELGVRPDVLIGGLGKAAGSQGGFVAGSEPLRTYLWNRARTLVFSTAPSPRLCADTLEQVRTARAADPERARLKKNAGDLRERLAGLRVPLVPGSFGPIVAVLVGDAERVVRVAERLRADGILAQPIRPPTVPAGSARLRVTLTASLEPADVERLAERIAAGLEAAG